MIRAIWFAFTTLAIVTVCCTLGVLSHWDTIWWLLILPASCLLAGHTAATSIDRYNWWALARAEREARTCLPGSAEQMMLNQRVARLTARLY